MIKKPLVVCVWLIVRVKIRRQTAEPHARIAKALITTAVGLAIAIPSMGVYYYLKQRVMGYMADLETSIEGLIDAWFLKPIGTARARAKQIKLAEKQAKRSSSSSTSKH